jgi:hypothetical protein
MRGEWLDMNEHATDLAVRVGVLERRVRRALVGGTALCLILAVVAIWALCVPLRPSVSAREFVLVDLAGNVRARLGQSELLYATPDGKTVRASTTCLMLFGDSSAAHLQACTTWEKPPQSSLLLTDSVGQRVLLTADDKGAQVLLGRRRNMGLGQDNSRIALASGDGNAFVHLQGRRQKGALLSLEGLTIFSEDRRKLAEVPSPTPSK